MNCRRRDVLAGIATAGSGGLAGCLGGEAGTLNAAPTSVAPAVLRETGYTASRTADVSVTRAVGIGPLRREITVTSVVSEYDRALSLPVLGRLQAAVFAVLSTPQVRVLGWPFNPIGDMSPDDLAELIQEHYGAIHALHQEATLEVTVRGKETTATRYRAQARLLAIGASIPIYLYVSNPVESERDFLVGIAAHPRTIDPQEDTVRRLLNGIVHPTAP